MPERKKRRDIDKETMFNKIMPTHLMDPDASDEEDIRVETVQRVIVKPGEEPPPPPPPETHSARGEKKQEDLVELLSKLEAPKKEPEPAPAPPPPKPVDLPHYVNLTELLVLHRLDSMIDKFKCCKCEACRQAIALHALNTLPPQYFFATNAAAEDAASRADSSAVIACMVQAIMMIRTNPPHPVLSAP